jgi:DNA-binding transcriptional regulator YiaG
MGRAVPEESGPCNRGAGGAAMTAKQFNSALDKLELSQLGFARVVGVTDRQCRRWASGENSVPAPVRKLLALMLAGRISIRAVDEA